MARMREARFEHAAPPAFSQPAKPGDAKQKQIKTAYW